MPRKRKAARVAWLPVDLNNRLNTAPVAATLSTDSSHFIKIFTAPPLGDPATTEEIAVVKDFAGGLGGLIAKADSSLADIEESGYRLRRIVGKLNFQCLQAAVVAAQSTIYIVTAGFIIRRVDQDGNSLGSDVGQEQLNVASLQSIMDPWIWRRSWMLANQSITAVQEDANSVAFPTSNIVYGAGIYDGPHVDAKTARIVGPEERLFLDVTVEGINGNAQEPPGAILLVGDLRVLASMRSNVGNRRNASR